MLYLYKGITPNFTKTHYVFSDFNNYLTFLETYKVKEINNDKYTMNNLVIRVKLDASISELDYKNVTYIISTSDSVCYLVNNSKIQSGYIFFNISIDNWGTYISKASFSDILIRRCNRMLSDNGLYDTIANTKDLEISKLGEVRYREGGCLLYLYVFTKQVEGETGFKTIDYRIGAIDNYISEAIDKASASKKIKIDNVFYNIEMKHIYIIKKSLIENYIIDCDDKFYKEDHSLVGSYLYRMSFNGTITDTLTYNTNLNTKINIGSMGGNINELKRTKDTQEINFIYSFAYNDFKLYVSNGDTQQEITRSIEIPLLSRDNTDATTDISTTLRYLLGVSQMGVGIVGESPLSFVKGLSTIVRNYENQQQLLNKTPTINMISEGNASSTYGNYIGSLSDNLSPYYLFISTSLVDEEKHARKLGANFNEYISTLTEIYNKEFLGTGESTDDTYIQATLEVSNIPTDAINDITGKFNNGVHTQLL